MARLTRKFLTALGIDDENIQDQIVEAHSEAVNALKAQRDDYKADAEKLATVEKERDDLKKVLGEDGKNPFEKKYNDLKKDFDELQQKIADEKTLDKKKSAVKAILKDIKIGDKWIDKIIKFTDFNKIELDGDSVKNADEMKANYLKEYADCVVTTKVKGADTETPPNTTGGDVKSRDEIMKIKDTSERQKEWAKLIQSERNND